MAVSLPYLSSNKNVETLFSKIHSAKVPDRVSQDFLKTTLGLKGSNDRPLIPLLRTLGFIDQAGAPTQAYRSLKNAATSKSAIAQAVRRAYRGLFGADEHAHKLAGDKLKGLVAQVAGTDDDMTARIAATFGALVKLGNFDGTSDGEDEGKGDGEGGDVDQEDEVEKGNLKKKTSGLLAGKHLQPAFHYNIQVHLP